MAYNDSRGRNFQPRSTSPARRSPTTAATTFTRLTKANGQSPFDNTLGDPVVLYDQSNGLLGDTVWLDAACGAQGLGGYKSTTPGDPNSWTHFCAFTRTPRPIESLAGLTATLLLRSTDELYSFIERFQYCGKALCM